MEGSSALSFSSLKTHFSFNLYNSCSSPKHTQMITFHPKHPQITGFEGRNRIFLSPSRRSLLLTPSFAIAEALKQSASPSLNKKEALSKVDNNGRFCSPRAARELALLIVYASCLEGTDPVRLFDKRLNEKRFPGYVFNKASLLEYDHMSFGGAPIALETEEEAEELLHNNEKESLIEEEVLSAPPKLVYNKFVLRLTRDILEAVVDKWDRHVHVIDKITPPNWKNEPASRILELCLLHLAMSEITAVGTRYQIVINETVDLAKRFCDGTAPRIINGCLRTFVKNYSENEVAQPSEGKS
ncbi:hypothetical protein MRB53_024176 [Persea americana]|uniref:Uncharacterized protein n=1 Tax=Persea americana TaxID=3435 RepID=A0ACC2LCP1_PERAE|nr:hypothetical protein MRB53_024176 [Persea americana]